MSWGPTKNPGPHQKRLHKNKTNVRTISHQPKRLSQILSRKPKKSTHQQVWHIHRCSIYNQIQSSPSSGPKTILCAQLASEAKNPIIVLTWIVVRTLDSRKPFRSELQTPSISSKRYNLNASKHQEASYWLEGVTAQSRSGSRHAVNRQSRARWESLVRTGK